MIGQKPFNIRLKKDFLLSKLVAIDSDLSLPGLGLSDESRRELTDKVGVIFHVAASVKFEAPLDVNIRHNVVATKELLEFACKFTNLLCFVHVSTAYSNCQLRQIDERIYPVEVPSDPLKVTMLTKEMIDNRPNTYTYTKAMAENVASQYASRMNVVIVRPSIVMSSISEPAEGWVDTINGPVGLSVLGALGILQKIKVNSEVVFDLIPVDIVTNALVSIAWAATEKRHEFLPGSSPSLAAPPIQVSPETGSFEKQVTNAKVTGNVNGNEKTISSYILNSFKCKNQLASISERTIKSCANSNININNNDNNNVADGTVRIFNLTTGNENPCSFYQYFSIGREEAYRKPSMKALRPLLAIPRQKGMNPAQYFIHKIFSHLLFAYIIDTLLGTFGSKKMVVKAVNRMHHANEVFDYFCSNQWNFVTDNVKRLRQLQSPSDRQEFNCDVRAIDWTVYAKIGWLGCRRFILNEGDETFAVAKRRYRMICFVYYVTKILLLAFLTITARICLTSTPAMWTLLLPAYGMIYLI